MDKHSATLEKMATQISVDAQEQLYRMMCSGGNDFLFFREPYIIELIEEGFCFEHSISSKTFEDFHINDIKEILENVSLLEHLPTKDRKKVFLQWLETNELNALTVISNLYIWVEFPNVVVEMQDRLLSIYSERFVKEMQKHHGDSNLLYEKTTPFFYQDDIGQEMKTANVQISELVDNKVHFDNWDSTIHEMPDQKKRMESGKKAAVTPQSVDKENKTATFKGSGKNPYIATLSDCTCADFVRRQLPCKHIYRLMAELNGEEVKKGINKNVVINHDLLSDATFLPVEAQESLYDNCVSSIYHQGGNFFLEKTPEVLLLVDKGYYTESPITNDLLESFHINTAKAILENIGLLEKLPSKDRKRCFVQWLHDDEMNILELVKEKYIVVDFSDIGHQLKHRIHRLYASRFPEEVVQVGDEYYETKTTMFYQDKK